MRHPARRLRLLTATSLMAASALLLGACGSDSGSDNGAKAGSDTAGSAEASPTTSASAFPVTLDSALGTATIKQEPKRVATWGWSAQDAVLALGIVPVAMPKYTYGGNADGILPWDADAIAKLGGDKPTLLSDSGQVPFEQFIAAKPDVILAPYSGLTQEDYDKLSQIAPTVAYPDKPWATGWQDQLTIVGKALGKSDEAAALQEKTDTAIADLAAKNPALKGKSFFYATTGEADTLNVYRASDPRVQLLEQLGMTVSPSVAALDAKPKEGTYFYPLSFEKASAIDADVLVAYFGDQAAADTFTKDKVIAAMPTVKEGRFAPIVGESYVMASSAPSVLAIPWMLDRYVPQLAKAAAKVG